MPWIPAILCSTKRMSHSASTYLKKARDVRPSYKSFHFSFGDPRRPSASSPGIVGPGHALA